VSVHALLDWRGGTAAIATGAAQQAQVGGSNAGAPAAQPRSGSRVLQVKSPDLPAGLVAGTCVQFDPTGADRHRTIYVDPGHGGPDPGAVGNGLAEDKLTLAVALQLKDMLRADGFHVVLSRVADTSVAKLADSQVVNGVVTNSGVHIDTIARIACGNTANADAMVAIHFNAFDDPSASGAETFYDDARDFSAANLRLANLLQAQLEASFQRLSGRTGPGAGRPSKLYRRSEDPISVSLPPRNYQLLAGLLAVAMAGKSRQGPPPALSGAARSYGQSLGDAARIDAGRKATPSKLRQALSVVLAEAGFEPFMDGGVVRLHNCPFHDVARDNTDLVCGMNLVMMEGVAEALEPGWLTAELEPAPGRCCVAFRVVGNNREQGSKGRVIA